MKTGVDLTKILSDHKQWLDGNGGTKANLLGANLSGATLSGANLSRANLYKANLSGATLSGANLSRANLSGANLSGADLYKANLSGATLSGADLFGANLFGANLFGANLSGADLYKADLSGANLSRANLSRANLSRANLPGANLSEANLFGANLFGAVVEKTCLDTTNKTTGADKRFRRVGKYVIGYRTAKAGHIDKYRVGRFYTADWFSTADTECHPGLYLWPTVDQARQYAAKYGIEGPIIMVRTYVKDVHKAGTRYRCRWFEVRKVIQ